MTQPWTVQRCWIWISSLWRKRAKAAVVEEKWALAGVGVLKEKEKTHNVETVTTETHNIITYTTTWKETVRVPKLAAGGREFRV